MKKILAIALLILCITAKKHHKQEEGQEEITPMVQCLQDHCLNEAFGCVFNEECSKTMESCDKEYGEGIKLEQFVSCTANDEAASALAACMQNNCASFEQMMRFFNKRK
ncbi:unnamed protein product (macronuclear) [Paramecium tetraurelia]|uniref:Uncharacterized protein n=1 Tax=Paramecium tetraurelia TaxID=5888 RepID=A0CB55_PARTE|nr:uncharacterized protein GSPATT00036805001 [Paramecium tetraurelia]CAK68022.1 unnamed protein product [Paramecium tetraurelia]|eukprot:XP_001435419.1 hypothetical protein (macronuclear) [Paramecium tetraurelia strain d4-2]